MYEGFSAALNMLLNVDVALMLLIGSAVGLLFGALPGLGGMMGMALALPFTFGWEPMKAIYLLTGITGACAFGGSIPAILINTPGTTEGAATCLDGYPMAKRGEAGRALGISATASMLGAMFGVCILVAFLPILRPLVLKFSAPEFLMLILFGLACIAFVAKGGMIRGLISGGFGILISTIGYSPIFGKLRFTFGSEYLWDGIPLLAFMVGLFAISELIRYTIKRGAISDERMSMSGFSGVFTGVKDVFRYKMTFLRSSAIGTLVGIIPGVGGTTANFLSYAAAVQTSRTPEKFGTGHPEGIIASEASNDAKDGGALVPTVAFGIPGTPSMAILLGAFILHGLTPGPFFIERNMPIIFALVIGLVIANIFTSTIGLLLANIMAKITTIKVEYLSPFVLILVLCGASIFRANIWDALLAALAGIFGYLWVRSGFSVVCMILGFVLGVLAESAFHTSLAISQGSYSIFFTRPITVSLLALLSVVLLLPFITKFWKKKGKVENRIDKRKEVGVKELTKVYRRGSFLLTAMLLVVTTSVSLISLSYGPEMGFVPLVISILSSLLLVLLLIGEIYPKLMRRLGGTSDNLLNLGSGTEHEIAGRQEKVKDVLIICAWIVGFFAVIVLLGFLIAIPAFMMAFLRIRGRIGWLRVLLMTVIAWGFAYGVFNVLMHANLFKGILFGGILPAI